MIARWASSASFSSTMPSTSRAGLAHDPAVAGGLRDLGGEHRDRVAVRVVRLEQLVQGRRVEQRDVAGDHDDRADHLRVRRGADGRVLGGVRLRGGVESGHGHLDGAARAGDLVLVGQQRLVHLRARARRRARARGGRRPGRGRGRGRGRWPARGRPCSGRPGCAGPWESPSASGFLHLRRGRRRRPGGGTSPGGAPRGSARVSGGGSRAHRALYPRAEVAPAASGSSGAGVSGRAAPAPRACGARSRRRSRPHRPLRRPSRRPARPPRVHRRRGPPPARSRRTRGRRAAGTEHASRASSPWIAPVLRPRQLAAGAHRS